MCSHADDPTFRDRGSWLFHAIALADPRPLLFLLSSLFPSLLPCASPLHRPRRRSQAAAPTPPQLRPAAHWPAPPRSHVAGAAVPAAPGRRRAPCSRPGLAELICARLWRRRRPGRAAWESTPRRRGGRSGVRSCAPGKLPGCLVRLARGGLGRRGCVGRDGVRVSACAGCALEACCAPLFHTQPVLCLCCLPWLCARVAFPWCGSLSLAPGGREGYLILSSSARGGRVEGRGRADVLQ